MGITEASDMTRFVDMTGTGLIDIVIIHAEYGQIDYWPNLGYCRFEERVRMNNAPILEGLHLIDGGRVFLADINGNGLADLVHINTNCIRFWLNQSGKG